MITADPQPSFAALARRLTGKVAALAEARKGDALLQASGDPRRWRRAALLWPLFTKG